MLQMGTLKQDFLQMIAMHSSLKVHQQNVKYQLQK